MSFVPAVLNREFTASLKKPSWNYKRLLVLIFSLILILVISVVSFFGYVAWNLGHPAIHPLESNPLQAIGTPYESISFPSLQHHSQLKGWYIPAAGSQKTVIFSHGYGANREEYWIPILNLAKVVHEAHYNVIMFDYGFVNPNFAATGGIREKYELLGAVQYAKKQGAEQVFVWGFSMGAGTALQAALDSNQINGMILDSTFVLSPGTLYHNVKNYLDIPRYPFIPLIRLFFPLFNGVWIKQIPYEQVLHTSYSIPIFMIHSKMDKKAPYQFAEDIFQNQHNDPQSEFWLTNSGMHELIYRTHPKIYLQRTMQFLQAISEQPNTGTLTFSK